MLDKKKTAVQEERQSKKAPLSDDEARKLLSSVSEVIFARGKSIRRAAAKETKPADLRGPTGSFRAPMVKRGSTLLVGFNAEELEKLVR